MSLSARPIRARFDAAALRHNHAVARRHAGAARLWSVVKANAYGHGLLRVATALREVADGFALLELEGAIALREAGFRQPILLLEGFYRPAELPLIARYQLIPALHCADQVGALVAARLPQPLPVVLKLNTGMNRLGLDPGEFPLALERLAASGATSEISLMTHFACADEPAGIAAQMQRLQAMTAGLRLPPRSLSLANSAALLRYPESLQPAEGGGENWARPGLMLYGASPFAPAQSAAVLDLRPVMTLEADLVAVREIAAGEAVGYGGAFVAEHPTRIGIVACGYADGYPRHAPSGTPVAIKGRRVPLIGRVSMDKLCVDLTGCEKVGVGDTATLWGGMAGNDVPVEEVAATAGTIAYELMCGLAARVPVLDTE
ncbi:MAG: alanine racemase [Betaproteobacteria bacterium HGW-Betaproteobacteria-11]|nr:MAG: alanine racemase [Betaproteobacteria bacterium HGW-Betaproteobacteria-11]